MAKCIIFCAGGFDALFEPVRADDYIMAADAGVRTVRALGLTPSLILGDFDSLGETPAGALVFPVRKDDPDSMLAVREGLARGYTDFTLYGALDGARPDMAVANYQALAFLANRGAHGVLVGKDYFASVVTNGHLDFPAGRKGKISVFCHGAPARGVTIAGLSYALMDGELFPDVPLGVSNEFTGAEASVSVREGSLLVFWQRMEAEHLG